MSHCRPRASGLPRGLMMILGAATEFGRDCSHQLGPALDPSLRITDCCAVLCKAVLKHLQVGFASMYGRNAPYVYCRICPKNHLGSCRHFSHAMHTSAHNDGLACCGLCCLRHYVASRQPCNTEPWLCNPTCALCTVIVHPLSFEQRVMDCDLQDFHFMHRTLQSPVTV